MAKNARRLFQFELAGAAFMVALGTALHFAFDWAGGWKPFAVVAAVNESIWEHLKLAFWPGVLWGAFIRLPMELRRAHVLAAKGLSLLGTAALIVVIFTSYTAIVGHNLLSLDIGTFVAAVVAGQLLSVWLLTRGAGWRRFILWTGLPLLAIQLAAYGLFTYWPPDHWLFIDSRSGLRGIPAPR